MAEQIGFVGLGIMGKPMARNLMKAGYSLTVYDIVGEPVEELVTEGPPEGPTARKSPPVPTRLSPCCPIPRTRRGSSWDPTECWREPDRESVVIDMSSIAPLVSQKIGAECAAKGVEFLDAPVSGGEPGAINGTLAIMVGGKQEVFDQCTDLLNIMGANVVLTGEVGAGNITKLANQIIVAANIEALSEAMVLAQKAGVDPEKVFNAIRGGLAGSAVMEAKGPMMLDRNFRAGFRIRLHQKDLRNVLQTGQELNVPLPVTALVQQMLGALVNDGKADADHSAILHFLEDLAKVEVKRGG